VVANLGIFKAKFLLGIIDECLTKGIDPEGQQAPQSMNEAVRHFFGARGGVKQWPEEQRTRAAQNITLVATGWQAPDRIPATFVSLPRDKSNKMRIPFVHGGKPHCGATPLLRGGFGRCGRVGARHSSAAFP